MSVELVKFNVGGTVFTTTRATLARSKVLCEVNDGAFFDRPATLFSVVLDFLRSSVVPVEMSCALLEEFRFFQVWVPYDPCIRHPVLLDAHLVPSVRMAVLEWLQRQHGSDNHTLIMASVDEARRDYEHDANSLTKESSLVDPPVWLDKCSHDDLVEAAKWTARELIGKVSLSVIPSKRHFALRAKASGARVQLNVVSVEWQPQGK